MGSLTVGGADQHAFEALARDTERLWGGNTGADPEYTDPCL